MRKKLKYIFLFLFASVFFSQKSWSACNNLSFTAQNALINLNSNPSPNLLIDVTRNGGSGCNFFFVIDNGTASTFANRSLKFGANNLYPIQFYTTSAKNFVLKSATEASTDVDVVQGVFSGGTNSLSLSYFPVLDPNVDLSAGPYTGSFRISMYTWNGSSLTSKVQVGSAKSVNYQYTKTAYANLSLVDSGAAFNIADTTQILNFGDLSTGLVMRFDVVLQYNSGYNLSMSSPNSTGTLNRLKNLSSPTNFINYTLRVNGVSKVLRNGGATTLVSTSGGEEDEPDEGGGPTISPAGGTRIPVSVTIGTVNAATTAGNYSDTVTVTVSSAF